MHAGWRKFEAVPHCKAPARDGERPTLTFVPDTKDRCDQFEPTMPELPAPNYQTAAAIYAAYEAREVATLPRPYLGASAIGHHCARYLWLSFRLAKREQFGGRMLRLFQRGHREEAIFIEDLRAIGCEVHDVGADGKQFEVIAHGGHFRGHMDGAVLGLPEAPGTWHLLEFKTSNTKSFAALQKQGVKEAQFKHWAQMQTYMALTGLTRAMYMSVRKETDEIYTERLEADAEAGRGILERAEQIIFGAEPPARINNDPTWWECKMCSMHPLCHSTDVPAPTCRSCAHVTPERDGTWTCERHNLRDVAFEHQLQGCQAHRFIPILLDNWADKVDASDADNVVEYRNRLTGLCFSNAEGGANDYSSIEIHAAADKRAIGNPDIEALKAAFDAKVAG
ncbi:MAG: PD-(D/E)XK nuclease family protein [Zoogloeaceae bacterium]|nr:PD-(D/E)XK nuclease family protein [Zoogloeaceae bacterium]